MDEGFQCPAEAGGGYYGSRATGSDGEGKSAEEEEENDAGILPYRLRVGCSFSPLVGVVGREVFGIELLLLPCRCYVDVFQYLQACCL